ncbi:MAG: hypothetical protein KID00_07845 [Clostridium argentinense]|uniref:Uncharacterized protein n=1 Tax=Clostridium faecium TaxID=2762223 RepID=A0ABR8YWN2_9CLOT|nr:MULTISPECIES: hypothetical protein [Clostridium]MBD8048697.1 hypothetical protein [Clostridium faecium]MBS5823762.1 hypothetical protein [Clostridium argentinense]MDU1347916.1 hypothetical protein [Clostridium argentinense]
MYYSDLKIYINDKVLFDLKNMDTYIINEQIVEIFEDIYYKKTIQM